MKSFIKSKTIWLGLLVALLPWLDEIQKRLDLTPETQTWASIVGVLVMLLRLVTTKPLVEKDTD